MGMWGLGNPNPWKGKDTLCLEPTFSWQFDDKWGHQLKVRRFSKDGLIAYTDDGQEWSSSCPLEEGGELVRLRRMTWMQHGEHYLYKERSDFKIIQEVPSVPSQLRWSSILDWRAEWRSALSYQRLPKKVLYWWMDALHTNLSVAYKKDCCTLCGDIVGSAHFLFECTYRSKVLRKLNVHSDLRHQRLIVSWCIWHLHVAKLHGKSKYEVWGRAKKLLATVSARSSPLAPSDRSNDCSLISGEASRPYNSLARLDWVGSLFIGTTMMPPKKS